MELWIRSQDKKQLLKVDYGLFIANGFTNTDDSFIGIKNVGHIGRYKTEERALEILDEIQKTLTPKGILKLDMPEQDKIELLNHMTNEDIIHCVNEEWLQQYDTYVYEMPKE